VQILYRLEGSNVPRKYMERDSPFKEVQKLYQIDLREYKGEWHCACESIDELNREWFGGLLSKFIQQWTLVRYEVKSSYRCPDSYQNIFFKNQVVSREEVSKGIRIRIQLLLQHVLGEWRTLVYMWKR